MLYKPGDSANTSRPRQQKDPLHETIAAYECAIMDPTCIGYITSSEIRDGFQQTKVDSVTQYCRIVGTALPLLQVA